MRPVQGTSFERHYLEGHHRRQQLRQGNYEKCRFSSNFGYQYVEDDERIQSPHPWGFESVRIEFNWRFSC